MEEKAFRHNVTERKPLKKPLAVHRCFMPFILNYHAMIYTNEKETHLPFGVIPHSAGAFFYIEEPHHSHVVGGRRPV